VIGSEEKKEKEEEKVEKVEKEEKEEKEEEEEWIIFSSGPIATQPHTHTPENCSMQKSYRIVY